MGDDAFFCNPLRNLSAGPHRRMNYHFSVHETTINNAFIAYNHCKQRVNTHCRYTPCTGRTPIPPRLGYEAKRSWGSSGYGQPPDRVLPCVGEVPGWCTTPGYDTYTGCTRTHHLMYTDRATQPGYVTYTFGVAPRVWSLHGNPFPLSYTNHGL